jgi:hypothetical protein
MIHYPLSSSSAFKSQEDTFSPTFGTADKSSDVGRLESGAAGRDTPAIASLDGRSGDRRAARELKGSVHRAQSISS